LPEEKRSDVLQNYNGEDSEYRIYIFPLCALIFLILVVLAASYVNYNTYFFKINDNKLELWHGDFAPMGFQNCTDFDPVSTDSHDFSKIVDKIYKSKERAYGALYVVFIDEVQRELDNGCEVDLKKVDHNLALADKFYDLCYWINPGFSKKRFEVSWKKVERLKDLLSLAYKDSLDHMRRAKSLGLAKDTDIEQKKKEAEDWLKQYPISP